jgi:hypothetical protein
MRIYISWVGCRGGKIKNGRCEMNETSNNNVALVRFLLSAFGPGAIDADTDFSEIRIEILPPNHANMNWRITDPKRHGTAFVKIEKYYYDFPFYRFIRMGYYKDNKTLYIQDVDNPGEQKGT